MIKRLKELREKATLGPWVHEYMGTHSEIATDNDTLGGIKSSPYDAELIVETINNLDKLLAVCEAAKKYRDIAAKGIMHNQTEFESWSDLDDSIAALEEE